MTSLSAPPKAPASSVLPDPASDPGSRSIPSGRANLLPLSLASGSPAPIPRGLALRLYTSHLLSTWNSRAFEFGAVLFLASIFPETLLPLSVYALARAGAAILFSQALGVWIDRGERLSVVRASILWQRAVVAASCGVFWALSTGVGIGETDGGGLRGVRGGLFALAAILGCLERLAAVVNLVAVERDWVVVITEGNEEARRLLNARMRRIDLFCKLVGPLAISSVAVASTLIAIWATLGMNIVSLGVEYVCIAKVYKAVPGLRRNADTIYRSATLPGPAQNPDRSSRLSGTLSWLKTTGYRILPLRSLPFYVHHPAFLPSISLSLLYFTVLSFSGQMITYLISVGYTNLYVGIARTVSTIFELSATWIAPRLMRRLGVVRSGIWSLCWQMAWLAAGVVWFFGGFGFEVTGGDQGNGKLWAATGLAVGVALSRVGLWGFDLCAQNIVQDEVEFDHRGAFSTVEAAFQNLFEMLSYAATIIFSRPDQFQWPVVVSVVAVYVAGALYASFVRKRRGHLFHAPPCIRPKPEEC